MCRKTYVRLVNIAINVAVEWESVVQSKDGEAMVRKSKFNSQRDNLNSSSNRKDLTSRRIKYTASISTAADEDRSKLCIKDWWRGGQHFWGLKISPHLAAALVRTTWIAAHVFAVKKPEVDAKLRMQKKQQKNKPRKREEAAAEQKKQKKRQRWKGFFFYLQKNRNQNRR